MRFELSWRNLNSVKHLDCEYNVHFMTSHYALNARSYLAKHLRGETEQCLWCQNDKTVQYIFYFCDVVQHCLNWLQAVLSNSQRAVVFLEKDFVFETFNYTDTNSHIYKAHIWKERTRAHYFEHRVTEEGLLESFKWELKEKNRFEFGGLPRSRFIEI